MSSSRIGDILMSQGLATCISPETQVITGTGDSDHSALLAKVPLDRMMLFRPGPDAAPLPMPSTLKTPVPAHQLAAFKEALTTETSEDTAQLNAELEETLCRAHGIKTNNPTCNNLRELLKVHGINADLTEEMAKKLQDIMSRAVPIAQKTCDYTDPKPDHKRHMSRGMSRKVQAELKYRKILNAAMQQYTYHKNNSGMDWHAHMRDEVGVSIQTLSEQLQAAFPTVPGDDGESAWITWHRCCKQQQQEKKQAAQGMRKQHKQKAFQKKKQRIRLQNNTQPKRLHQMIFCKAAAQV